MKNEKIETVIIGGGQAGLATSYHLKQLGQEHVIFEQADKLGNAWRNGRWDSFTLVTPNWSIQLPGAHYAGKDPDGFLPKNEIVAYFEQYVEKFKLPVEFNTSALEVKPLETSKGYQVRTNGGIYHTRNVVMATGSFQRANIPAFSVNLPTDIKQLYSGHYRNPGQLPEGAVLVIGINAPRETLPELQDGFSVDVITELDLQAARIKIIIWAMGYRADYGLVKLPVTDEDGYPLQKRGVTQYPGLYFVGMNWLHKRKSVTLLGVNEDVEHIIAKMTK